jgi:hypothetical protein
MIRDENINFIALHCIALHCTALHSTAQHSTARHCMHAASAPPNKTGPENPGPFTSLTASASPRYNETLSPDGRTRPRPSQTSLKSVDRCSMTNVQMRILLPGQFHLLSHAFHHATRRLSKAESTPAIKACLADKFLTVLASGESDPVRLSQAALATMRGCLRNCTGCPQNDGRFDARKS